MKTKFAERIKEIRVNLEMTQKELAKELHVSRVTISRWEKQERQPNLDMLADIMMFFKETAEFLLGFDDFNFDNED